MKTKTRIAITLSALLFFGAPLAHFTGVLLGRYQTEKQIQQIEKIERFVNES